uniref:Uncharacterized protein n=1 Tax=Arundo donax TaxID=35708 RepID=A0A0A9BVZ6_ARUDO
MRHTVFSCFARYYCHLDFGMKLLDNRW